MTGVSVSNDKLGRLIHDSQIVDNESSPELG